VPGLFVLIVNLLLVLLDILFRNASLLVYLHSRLMLDRVEFCPVVPLHRLFVQLQGMHHLDEVSFLLGFSNPFLSLLFLLV